MSNTRRTVVINVERIFRMVPCRLAIIAMMLSWQSGCAEFNPGNVWIPLPLQYHGEAILIAGHSRDDVTIVTNDSFEELVPSKVEYVSWDDGFLAAKIRPMVNRNSFPGDTYTMPDTTKWEWYVIDLESSEVDRLMSEKDFHDKLRERQVDPDSVRWLNLQQAWDESEKALGFDFTSDSIKSYLGR